MLVEELDIAGVYLLKPEMIEDRRGYFFREFCRQELIEQGINIGEIVQCNRSFNKKKGTFRGLHYQRTPFCEEKIVSCLKGAVADVIIDLRVGSSTFLQNRIIELSDKNNFSLLIPKGCAHGFITKEDYTELRYMHTNFYNPEAESACSILDPKLKIELPITIKEISKRDKMHKFIDRDFKGVIV